MSEEVDYDIVVSRITSIYSSCNKAEKRIFKTILQETADRGYSKTLEQVWMADFKEVPVSIEEFICNPEYLGETNNNGEMVYPFWKHALSEIFQEDKNYCEIIFSGATRIGKTSTAILGMSYMLYRLMLYRDPHTYFRLKTVSKFTIAFANLTKELACGVGYREFNDTLKQSQWFCLLPNTRILTNRGYLTIEDASKDPLVSSVISVSNQGCIHHSDFDSIAQTGTVYDTIRLTLEDGSSIEGTPDHMIMLSDGSYKRLVDISIDDDIKEVCTEVFVPMSGFDGYEISSLGRIRNINTKRFCEPLSTSKDGYLVFRKYEDGKEIGTEYIPQVMVRSFYPDIDDTKIYLIDRDRYNNSLSNIGIGRRPLGADWKPIPGTDGLFEVSKDGKIYRHPVFSNVGRKKKVLRSCIINQQEDKDGYMVISGSYRQLSTNKVHRLVAMAWIPNPEDKPTVDHIDGNKKNNSIDNLRWATYLEQSENMTDRGAQRYPGAPGIHIVNRVSGKSYSSICSASKDLGISKYFIAKSLETGELIRGIKIERVLDES